jgi:hypothetical protein
LDAHDGKLTQGITIYGNCAHTYDLVLVKVLQLQKAGGRAADDGRVGGQQAGNSTNARHNFDTVHFDRSTDQLYFAVNARS